MAVAWAPRCTVRLQAIQMQTCSCENSGVNADMEQGEQPNPLRNQNGEIFIDRNGKHSMPHRTDASSQLLGLLTRACPHLQCPAAIHLCARAFAVPVQQRAHLTSAGGC
eukprot:scaffold110483_cov17-Tisochrysis_lutea.AAC.1